MFCIGLAELQRSNNHNVGADVNRISPTNARQNVTSTSAGKWRGCKRKGGWKFHDLSDESDGLGRRKRAYCHNRLENEILQVNIFPRLWLDRKITKSTTSVWDRRLILTAKISQQPQIVSKTLGISPREPLTWHVLFNVNRLESVFVCRCRDDVVIISNWMWNVNFWYDFEVTNYWKVGRSVILLDRFSLTANFPIAVVSRSHLH